MRHAVGIKNDAELAGKSTKTRHPQVVTIAKMAKNGQKNTKRNHRAQEMADFMENCRENEHQKHKRNHRAQEMADFMGNCRKMSIKKRKTKPPRSRNGRFYGKLSEK